MNPVMAQALRAGVAAHYSGLARSPWLEHAAQLEAHQWEEMAEVAVRAGLGPLLRQSMLAVEVADVPQAALARLEQSYFQAATHNLLALTELQAILKAFAAKEIKLCLLKGAAVIHSARLDPALRPMVDLDLLVLFGQLQIAQEALENLGYRLAQPTPFPDKSGLFWNQLLMVKPGQGNMAVELHWCLVDIPHYADHLSAERIFDRAQLVKVGQTKAAVPGLADQVLHLCAHQLYHHERTLGRTWPDLGFVVTQTGTEVDWGELLSLAEERDLRLAVREILREAAQEWYVPIPKSVLSRVAVWQPRPREHFFVRAQHSEFLKLLRTLVTLPGLVHRVRFAWGQLFPGREYLTWRYGLGPEGSLPMAYTQRFVSGLKGLMREIGSAPKPGNGQAKSPDDSVPSGLRFD